jgi:hypothetical protein
MAEPVKPSVATPNDEVLTQLFSLILGNRVTKADLSSAEVLQRLAESLNAIFDSLNKLVSVIKRILLGEDTTDETIRQVIGIHLEGEDQINSLESYLGQISKAFLLSQKAFSAAAYNIVDQILQELDPEKISQQAGSGLRFGPLRKAEFYDIYEQNMKKCRKWFNSGRFKRDLQREFENYCQSASI